MKKFIAPDWAHLGITNEVVKFLFQRWMELLDTSVPISFQAPVSGALQILRELQTAWEELDETGYGASAVQAITEEAFGVNVGSYGKLPGTVNEDTTITKLVGSVSSWRESNRKHFTTGGVTSEIATSREQALVAHLLAVLEKKYVASLVQRLEDIAFGSGETTQSILEETDELVSSLVSELLALGFADSFLRSHRRTLEADSNPQGCTERDRFKRFINRLTLNEETIRCIFNVQAVVEFWSRWPTNVIQIYTKVEEIEEFPTSDHNDSFIATGPTRRFIELSVNARDHHAASRIGHYKLQKTADIVSAESPSSQIRVLGCTTLRQQGGNRVASYAERNNMQLDPLPPKVSLIQHGIETDQIAINLQEGIKDESSRRRIEGALRYYRISREEQWMESGLTNLWTALEVLSPIIAKATIIDRIANSIAPLVGGYKVKDTMDSIVRYLINARIHQLHDFRRDFSDTFGENEFLDPVLILKLLASEERTRQLLAILPDSPLLRLRIQKISKITQNGRNLALNVYKSSRRVEWQIRRLYRLRNTIVHGAASPANVQRILHHLQLYVSRSIVPESVIDYSRPLISSSNS